MLIIGLIYSTIFDACHFRRISLSYAIDTLNNDSYRAWLKIVVEKGGGQAGNHVRIGSHADFGRLRNVFIKSRPFRFHMWLFIHDINPFFIAKRTLKVAGVVLGGAWLTLAAVAPCLCR